MAVYPEQVANGLTIPLRPVGFRNKGLINTKKPKFDMHSHSFQDTELKIHRYVNDTPGQIMHGGINDLYAQREIVTGRFIITYMPSISETTGIYI